jgi:predicted nuclease with RNAse H fold
MIPQTRRAVAGLDLSGSYRRCSGYSEIDIGSRRIAVATCLYRDEDIVSTIASRVSVVAIDAPIAREARMRELDREAIRRGYRVLPPSMRGMRMLTQRAWKISLELINIGVEVIETHPRSAIKSSGTQSLEELLSIYGIEISPEIKGRILRRKDIEDAIVASVVAYCYYIGGECIEEIRTSDGTLYLLKSTNSPTVDSHSREIQSNKNIRNSNLR